MATSNTQNLLDEIFGSSPPTETTSTAQTPALATSAASPPKPRNVIDDILGLFPDSTSTHSPNPINTMVPGLGNGMTSPAYGGGSPMPTTVPQSAFSLPQTQSPSLQPQQQQRLTAYTAYEKNELKVTLTPQTNPNKPGIVSALARFQVTGQNAVSGLSFQVAVPKVRFPFFQFLVFGGRKLGAEACAHYIEPAAANAGHVQSEREPWMHRDSTDADQGSRWRTFLFPASRFLTSNPFTNHVCAVSHVASPRSDSGCVSHT